MSKRSARAAAAPPPPPPQESGTGTGTGTGSTSTTTTNTTTGNSTSCREVYETTGDAVAALKLLLLKNNNNNNNNNANDANDDANDDGRSSSNGAAAQAYNQCLLQAMIQSDDDSDHADLLWQQLPALEDSILSTAASAASATTTSTSTLRKRRRQEWTLTYNRGLLLLAQGQANLAMATIWKVLEPIVAPADAATVADAAPNQNPQSSARTTRIIKKLPQDLLVIACRMGLVMIEGILTLGVGNPLGIPKEWKWNTTNSITDTTDNDDGTTGTTTSSSAVFRLDVFLEWLSTSIEQTSSSSSSSLSSSLSSSSNKNQSLSQQHQNQSQQVYHSLKFALALYTARLGFLDRGAAAAAGGGSTGTISTAGNDIVVSADTSAVLLLSTAGTGKMVESQIRLARKELKQAMEIFQHKLKPPDDDGAEGDGASSMASSSVLSDNNYSNSNYNYNTDHHHAHHTHSHTHTHSHPNQQPYDSSQVPFSSSLLQRQNQAGLNLKANTEQLKGNIKKSLILCQEAAQADPNNNNNNNNNYGNYDGGGGGRSTAGSYYDALHYNNLAIVYETHGKTHLALHSWSKAVACANNDGRQQHHHHSQQQQQRHRHRRLVERDGTARLDVTCKILWNAAMGSFQARNFWAAYECLGTCLEHSEIWRQRKRAWLRLGEACIGIWYSSSSSSSNTTTTASSTAAATTTTTSTTTIESEQQQQDGANMLGCIIPGGGGFSAIHVGDEPRGIILEPSSREPEHIGELAPVLASPEDMEQLQINPLPRARAAFEYALELMAETKEDPIAALSAQVSLAYICLETKDFQKALEYAESVLKEEKPETGLDSASEALFQRQQATARMYASEAACVLGDAVASMKFLVGDGKNDAFDRLASALGGVTIETANRAGTPGKMRLAKAQAMVRCSASAASACMGNLAAAKQLAMSAQAMSREGSYATRALVYCMLREGNRGAALTLLRSAR